LPRTCWSRCSLMGKPEWMTTTLETEIGISQLIDYRHKVVTTVRSHDKGKKILAAHPDVPQDVLSYVVVEDIAKENAFDEAVKSDPPFEAVIHTASPFFFGHTDPVKEILDPAIKGTTGILKSIYAYAPTVKQVAITSSFAAMVRPNDHPKLYDESVWNPVTQEEALEPTVTYRASKTFAERAAWDFLKEKKPNFTITTLDPPLVLGPVIHYLNSLEAINTSNQRVRDLVLGKYKDELPPSGTYIWVDVRDLAEAHVLSIEKPEAANQRFFVTQGYFSNKQIADVIRDAYPSLADKLPSPDTPDDIPESIWAIDNSKSKKILGLKYRSLAESIKDTVESIKEVGGLTV
jgi:nucleoside-diphosphate-sugar epimerase